MTARKLKPLPTGWHIHHWVEDGHGTNLWSGAEDWSFHCTYKNCPVGLFITHYKRWSIGERDLSDLIARKKQKSINKARGIGCRRCGWEPRGKMTSAMRNNRMREHRRRAHHI